MLRTALRYLLAIAGGLAITVTMLIGMSHFAAMFQKRGGDRVFLIDILKVPRHGRPDRPGAAALPPSRDVDRLDNGTTTIPLDGIDAAGTTIKPETTPPDIEPPPAN